MGREMGGIGVEEDTSDAEEIVEGDFSGEGVGASTSLRIFRESSEALRGKKVDNDLCLKISLLETAACSSLGRFTRSQLLSQMHPLLLFHSTHI